MVSNRHGTLPRVLYVFGLPRSGSNLFAAYMHNSPAIWSLNCGGGKFRSIASWEEATLRCIYANGGFQKGKREVKYFLFDEMKPRSTLMRIVDKWHGNGDKNIVILRDPVSVASSMQKFAETYSRPAWDLSNPRRLEKFVNGYKLFLKRCSYLDTYWLSLVDFFTKADEHLLKLNEYLEIELLEHRIDFPLSEMRVRCYCGGEYKCSLTDTINGTFFRLNSIKKTKPEKVLCCRTCGEYLLGYGGFNPIKKIEPHRLKTPIDDIPVAIRGSIKKVIEKCLGEEFWEGYVTGKEFTGSSVLEFARNL
ncbi:MAG: hypothetical protein MI685_11045 [Chlorobiales bacterium]|nr:hypothetical protein [Chlorobiales bacterium]